MSIAGRNSRLGAAVGLALCAAALGQAEESPRHNTVVKAVGRVMPSVVNIATKTRVQRVRYYYDWWRDNWAPYAQELPPQESAGSGVVVDDSGYVLTNVHVVKDADEIWVKIKDQNSEAKVYRAEAIAGSLATDIALLKITPNDPDETFTAATFASDDDLSTAQSAAKRMEGMIDNIVRTLGENASGVTYELSVVELLEIFRSRLEPSAAEQGVRLEVSGAGGRELDNREGNLVLLILENLAQNAIEAAGRGGRVAVRGGETPGVTAFEVIDNGRGLPEAVKGSLFQPGNTSKEKGSGLGLAISGQLAGAVGAELSLAKSDENGTTFRLALAKRDG